MIADGRPPAPPTPWYATLGAATRDAVFAWMRDQDARAERARRQARELSPRHGEIAVGSGAFDPLLEAITIEAFLRCLRLGGSPDQAEIAATAAVRDAVERHNAVRPRDTNWQRSASSDLPARLRAALAEGEGDRG